jgi:hypothetical protein
VDSGDPPERMKVSQVDGQSEMTGDAAEAAPKPASQEPRQRSTISFPYMDLASAIQMAGAIFKNVAGGICDDNQLAVWTDQSPKSSTFRIQVYASRIFGVLTGEGSQHKLTPLGIALVDHRQADEAKARAFLTVPLYRAVFERFKGGVLPPAAALEREMVELGVSPKQKDKARQVFERSAEQAGFFAHGRDRLVQPGVVLKPGEPEHPADESANRRRGTGDGGDLDPLIAALIQKLPAAGTTWLADERVTWLRMIAMAFQMAYGQTEEIEIKKAS